MPNSLTSIIIMVMVSGAIGGFAGYQLRGSSIMPENIEPAPERRLEGGELVLKRDPAANIPKTPTPAGATTERRVRVTAQPTKPDCPPIDIDLSLIREGQGRRVIASSPNGRIISGVDIPIERAVLIRELPWAAGLSYNLTLDGPGIWVTRDLGRARIGLDVYQRRFRGERDIAVRGSIGWRW